MSRYLQRLVLRTADEAGPAIPLVPGSLRESGERSDFDPFEVVAEPTQALEPPPQRPPILRNESMPLPPAPAPTPVGVYTRLFRSEPPPTAIPPANAQSLEIEPALCQPGEGADSVVAPHEEIPAAPREVRPPARIEPPTVEQLEPSRRQPSAPADELAEAVRVPPGRQSRVEEAEPPLVEDPPPHDRRELEPPESPDLVTPPVQRAEPLSRVPPTVYSPTENPPALEPDSPLLVIGRLQVDVVPAERPVREVVRVVSRAVTGAARPAATASKLRFGLGQM